MTGKETKEPDLRFGWGKFKPKCLQFLNGPKWFLVLLIVFSMMQGLMVNGLTKLVLPSIEKRFQFTGKELGVISASNDISALLLVVFVSFYGGYGNKIRWLGYGAFITGLGGFVYAFPQVLIGPYYPSSNKALVNISFNEQDLCMDRNQTGSNGLSLECISTYNSEWFYLIIFVCGQLLMGAGTSPLFTLGPAYIDENVPPKDMPLYLGVWFASTILGPGLGFVFGGAMLSVFVDIEQPVGMDLNTDDVRWIGAWWLGYVAGSSFLFISAVGILGYPPELPGSREMRAKAMEAGDIPKKDDQIKGQLMDIIPATKNLLTNKTYIFNTLATAAGFFSAGISTFIPKILQDKFAISSVDAGYTLGGILVPGMFLGVMSGGYIVRRFKVKESCKMAAKLCVIFSIFSLFGPTSWFIPGCDPVNLAGVTKPYPHSNNTVSLDNVCNTDCACTREYFNPVCGPNEMTYISPCHAGCKTTSGQSSYANCTCFHSSANRKQPTATKGLQPTATKGLQGTASKGYCDRGDSCMGYIAFLCTMLVFLLTIFLKAIPTKTVILRCVPFNQRAYALGLQFVFFRSLGTIPSPIFYGFLFDKNCVLWGESCGEIGNCFMYDMDILSYYLAGFGYLFSVMTIIFFFLSFWYFESADDPERVDEEMLPLEIGEKKEDVNENIENGSPTIKKTESPASDEDASLLGRATGI